MLLTKIFYVIVVCTDGCFSLKNKSTTFSISTPKNIGVAICLHLNPFWTWAFILQKNQMGLKNAWPSENSCQATNSLKISDQNLILR